MPNSFEMIECLKIDKKRYVIPQLTMYGNVADITLKEPGPQDHNNSGGNANGMGDKISLS